EEKEYPDGWKLLLPTIGICLTIILVSLDFSIMATAVPAVTSEFHTVEDVGWYGSAYLLTTASAQLLVGSPYTISSIKWVFLTSLLTFELGSVICGVAPSSVVLILGRAIAGCGDAGPLSGALLIVGQSVLLERHPLFA
ncbi:MFS general substrate transporter, partial [Aspergillus brunneoviolaceus CBS 621.78]